MFSSLSSGFVPSLYRYMRLRSWLPFHDSFAAVDSFSPTNSAAIGYSSYLMWSCVINPIGLYVRLSTTYFPSGILSMQYGMYTALKSSLGIFFSFFGCLSEDQEFT